MDLIQRLENPDMCMDAIDDAIHEIQELRERVKQLENTQEVAALQADNSELIRANIEVAQLNASLQERIADLDEKVDVVVAQEAELLFYRNQFPSAAMAYKMVTSNYLTRNV